MSDPNKSKSDLEDSKKLQELLQRLAMQQMDVSKSQEDKVPAEHKFWKTQPVPQYDEVVETEGAIDNEKNVQEIRQNPYPLPGSFDWVLIDLENPEELKEVYTLLSLNYVEDDDATFRFDYTPEFISWALKPPGWKKAWHLGVRATTNQKLVAFISGVPADLKIRTNVRHLVEINFLCIHKKLRSKRLAPLLIKEITRRVNMEGIFQATYTAGIVIPKPIATCRYHHRSLNPKKLVEIGFSALPRGMTMDRLVRRYKLPNATTINGLRPMLEQDIVSVRALLNRYLAQFDYGPVFQTDEDVRHYFLPIKDVVYSYVVENRDNGAITDFVSFYSLPSSVLGNPKHKTLNAAYLYYYATDVSSEPVDEGSESPKRSKEYTQRLQALVRNAMILANNAGFDVMNALELLHNTEFIEELKFGPGDGYLNYYLYNWRCPPIENEKMALVMF
ncbi:N-myristoyl transferase [Basidiobolus meristosporus CBS 931.73]|uniref:Glycylpeptide N-tetradecanoyltransferase n=1 Tax=Basidiobolus meristosporus CBS 931.73 TaxID=1314790 RepID=A0A1Y1XVW0_9FUNG|nr:N-myristoyl transferase [Basidiobolus meristosporus CBS 931.73]|eukprot:ORX89853.1 N-myristoyl transferase [Basidiobolus meristosporus CBS 931.73]